MTQAKYLRSSARRNEIAENTPNATFTFCRTYAILLAQGGLMNSIAERSQVIELVQLLSDDQVSHVLGVIRSLPQGKAAPQEVRPSRKVRKLCQSRAPRKGKRGVGARRGGKAWSTLTRTFLCADMASRFSLLTRNLTTSSQERKQRAKRPLKNKATISIENFCSAI